MKDANYLVKRDDIYFGRIIKSPTGNLNVYEDGQYEFLDDVDREAVIKLKFECCMHEIEHLPSLCLKREEYIKDIRTMLFVVDTNKLANDLLYSSPKYPILNISDNQDCLSANIFIERAFTISKILEYYHYPEMLTYEDIIKIRNTFFGDFILDNCTLFGIKETERNRSRCETFDRYGRHRTFNGEVPNGVFPECYFRAFWRVSRWDFWPSPKEEGLVKSLKKVS